MKIKKIDSFFVVFFYFIISILPNQLFGQCCAAGNPVSSDGSNSQGKGILKVTGLYQHSFSDTYFEGPNISDFTYKNTYYDFNSLKLAYGLTDRFNLAGELGYFINKSEYFVLTDYSRYAKGIGDAALTLRYSLKKNPSKFYEISSFFTLKLPIGVFDQIYNNVLLPIDLQPSSGSFRYKPGFSVYKGFDNNKFGLFTMVSAEFAQAIKTERTINYKYGNLFLFSIFGTYQPFPWLKTSLEVREMYRQMANNNGTDIQATGGNVVFLVPRATTSLKGWNLSLTYEQPIYKNLNSVGYPQLSNKYAISVSLDRNINLLKKPIEPSLILGNLNYKVDSFYVNGICDMCKERITTTAKKVKGVDLAIWSKERKMLIIYHEKEVAFDDLLKKIADAGHDNQAYTADNRKYEKLHECCKYREVSH